jgi:hypothetical protein
LEAKSSGDGDVTLHFLTKRFDPMPFLLSLEHDAAA